MQYSKADATRDKDKNQPKKKENMNEQTDKKNALKIITVEPVNNVEILPNELKSDERPILNFLSNNLVQGLILSEILGKPKSRRRGR